MGRLFGADPGYWQTAVLGYLVESPRFPLQFRPQLWTRLWIVPTYACTNARVIRRAFAR